jgi:hypothetical protein
MSTLADLRSQIEDDLARGDLTTQILRSIKHAVRTYETDRFWFNEVKDSTVTLSSSAVMLDLTTLSPTWLKFDRIRRKLDTNAYLDLIPRDYAYIMSSRDHVSLAPPCDYTIYGNAIQFDTMANEDTTLVFDGIRRVSESVSQSSDASVWFNDAVDLIRARTKKDLALHIIMDTQLASACDSAERLAYSTLKGRMNRLKTSGMIRGSDF